MRFTVMSGTGNVFAVVDAFEENCPVDPAAAARSMCRGQGSGVGASRRLDGLILVGPAAAGGDVRMRIFNADGTRPEACGNGVRLAGKLARESRRVLGNRLRVETDSGVRDVELLVQGDCVSSARVLMGRARILEAAAELVLAGGAVRATLVDIGNPHCVLFVPDERKAPVSELGPELERHSRFPAGTNVEFVSTRELSLARRLCVRVWERGVGETAACGTGACAAAEAARERGMASGPLTVSFPGGDLSVDWTGTGEIWLAGSCEAIAAGEWHPAGTRGGR